MLELVIGVRFRVRVWVMIMIWGLYLRYGLELYGLCVRKGGFYGPDSASSLYYKGSASLNGTIKLSACA